MHEFEMIARLLAPLSAGAPLAYHLADDAAAVRPKPGHDLIVTVDAMIEDVHFRRTAGAGDIARKLLRVNLSDLAAKGAQPIGYLLTLALPRDLTDGWMEAFAAGLAEDQETFHLPLLGGDTSAAPDRIALTITALGELPQGRMILRSGARPGDAVYVTGMLGDAALGLLCKEGMMAGLDAAVRAYLLMRLHRPEPRLSIGRALAGIATACLDISDGLVQDLGHIARASGVSLHIEADKLPLSDAMKEARRQLSDPWPPVLAGGDDYELAFTAPAQAEADLKALGHKLGTPITKIGLVKEGSGVSVTDAQGQPISLSQGGWQHF